jgi:hypothetical protein
MEMVEVVVVEEDEVVELLLLEMSINYDTLDISISISIIIWNSIMKYNNYLVCQQQKKESWL